MDYIITFVIIDIIWLINIMDYIMIIAINMTIVIMDIIWLINIMDYTMNQYNIFILWYSYCHIIVVNNIIMIIAIDNNGYNMTYIIMTILWHTPLWQ